MRETSPPRAIGRDITVWIAIVLAAAAGLWRASQLDDYWFNPDEGLYHEIVSGTDAQHVREVIRVHPHPPLFYWALWSMDAAPDGSDIARLRIPSVLLASLSILLAYWLGREVVDGGTGLVLAGLTALSPALNEQALVIRQYSWVLPCLLLGAIATVRGLRTGRSVWIFTAWLALALGLTLHYSAGVLAGGLLVLTVAAGIWPRASQGRLRLSWLAALLPFIAAGIWVWESNLRPLLAKTNFLDQASATWLEENFITGIGSFFETNVGALSYAFGRERLIVSVILFVGGLVFAWRRRLGWAGLFGGGVVVLASVAALAHVYPFGATRQASVWIPFLALPMAIALREILASGVRRAIPVLGILAAVAVFGGSLLDALGWTKELQWLKTVGEQAIPMAAAEEMRPALERLSLRSGTILTDQQSWAVIHPFIPKTDRERYEFRGEPGLKRVPWGTSDVIVVKKWILSLMPERDNDQRVGVPETLHRAREAYPELFPGEDPPVFLIAAGWYQPWMFGFPRLKRAASGQSIAVKGMRNVTGIGLFRLDLGAYDRRGALLAAPRGN